MASEVVDAEGLRVPLLLVWFGCGVGVGAAEACDEAEVVLAAEVLAVPLVLAAPIELLGGERLALEAVACELMDWFDERRVDPTSLRNRLFIEDMDSSPAAVSTSIKGEGFSGGKVARLVGRTNLAGGGAAAVE